MSEPLRTIAEPIAFERDAASLAAHKSIKMRLETIAVRAGAEIDATTGALSPPLHLSTTFEHGPASEAIHGFLYVRQKNPTQSRLEAALRDLEDAPRRWYFLRGWPPPRPFCKRCLPVRTLFSPTTFILTFAI